jgi:hypothetical protein
MGLVIFYASINWMPILLKDAGLAPKSATLIALFPLGGVGAVLCGVLMDRFNANRVIAVCYALTAISVYAIGQAAGNVGLLVLVVFVAGVLMNTAQSSMPALAAAFYRPRAWHGRRMDAGRGTFRRDCRVVPRRGTDAPAFLVRVGVRDDRGGRPARMRRAAHQADGAAARRRATGREGRVARALTASVAGDAPGSLVRRGPAR